MNFSELDKIVTDIKRNIYSSIKDKKILNEEVLVYSMPYYLENIYLIQKLETIDNIRAYVWCKTAEALEKEGYDISFNINDKEETCLLIIKWKNFVNLYKEKFDKCKEYISSKTM